MTRFRIVLEYRGTAYVGWQVQPDGPSVQSVLEAALAQVLDHPVRVSGSGRTDAGVHALAQVASFTTDAPRRPDGIRDGLNARLPDDVACIDADVVPDAFDPRRDAKRKLYRYTLLDRRPRSPAVADRSWHVRRRLDERAMHTAAQQLVGRHDFAAFRAAGCASTHAVRTVASVDVHRDGDLVHVDVVGNGFLRHMVRIVAGTLVDVGLGKLDADGLAAILASRDRTRAGKTAPPHGLTLMWVRYDGERISDDGDDDDE